jgi:hypothetical protein
MEFCTSEVVSGEYFFLEIDQPETVWAILIEDLP